MGVGFTGCSLRLDPARFHVETLSRASPIEKALRGIAPSTITVLKKLSFGMTGR